MDSISHAGARNPFTPWVILLLNVRIHDHTTGSRTVQTTRELLARLGSKGKMSALCCACTFCELHGKFERNWKNYRRAGYIDDPLPNIAYIWMHCMATTMHPARLCGGFRTCIVCGPLVTHWVEKKYFCNKCLPGFVKYAGDAKTCFAPHACLTNMPGFLRSGHIYLHTKQWTASIHRIYKFCNDRGRARCFNLCVVYLRSDFVGSASVQVASTLSSLLKEEHFKAKTLPVTLKSAKSLLLKAWKLVKKMVKLLARTKTRRYYCSRN